MAIYIIIIVADLLVALLTAGLITGVGSNHKLSGSFVYYAFLSFFFTPIIALLFAILDALTISKGEENVKPSKETKPVKLEGGKIWIANEKDKRITIYESELDDYLANGWHKING